MSLSTHNQYAINTKVRTKLKQRLMAEGRWDAYVSLREAIRSLLKEAEADGADSIAWKIAAIAFCPANGNAPEVFVDAMYAGIVADWHAGKYDALLDPTAFVTFPNGFTDMRKLVGEASPELKEVVEKVKKAPKDYADRWEQLALAVRGRTASPQEIVEWVVANEPFSIENIDPDSVPSTTAITLLKYAKATVPNLGDVLKTIWVRLMPDRKTVEYENNFRDKGQSLALLEDLERSWKTDEEDAA